MKNNHNIDTVYTIIFWLAFISIFSRKQRTSYSTTCVHPKDETAVDALFFL